MFPFGYIDALEVYNKTHSREILKKIGSGRPTATYAMLEADITKAKETWSIPFHETCVVAVDNNQLKIGGHDATYHERVVICNFSLVKNC